MNFAIHLVRQGRITPSQMVDAIEHEQRFRKPLGQLAVESGMLTQKQVIGILALQPDFQQPFGRIAVDLGYLTEKQLGELLLVQAERSKRIGEFLVESGAISRPDFLVEQRRYYEEVSQDVEQAEFSTPHP